MKASLRLPPSSFTSKADDRNWTREVWLASYRQARAQIREGGRFGLGARYVWALDHLRRRFGASGWRLAQAAARLVLERRTPGHAASVHTADLHRRGLVTASDHPTRCIYVEEMTGCPMAWSANALASSTGNHMLRALR